MNERKNSFFSTFNQEYSQYSRTLVVWHSVVNEKIKNVYIPAQFAVVSGGPGVVFVPAQASGVDYIAGNLVLASQVVPVQDGAGGSITVPAQNVPITPDVIIIPGTTVPVIGGGGGTVTLPAQLVVNPFPRETDLFEPFFIAPFHVTLLSAVMISTPTIEDEDYIIPNYFFAGDIRVHATGQRVWGPPGPFLPGGDLMARESITGVLCDGPIPMNLSQISDFTGAPQRLFVESGERVGLYPDLDNYSISDMNFDCITVGLLFGYN
jgi:hypothetical protein